MKTTVGVARRLRRMVLLAVGLVACASTGRPLSQESANELAGHSIRAFLKERFVEAVRTIKVGEETKVRLDGSVLLEALYTDVNMAQLHRPSIELARFCHAQQGKISRTDVNRPAERAAADAERRKVGEDQFCNEFAARGEGTELDCRAAMVRFRSYEHVPLPRVFAAEAEQEALPREDFGHFSCRHAMSAKHPDWDVVVEGIDFDRGESGTLKANSLTLLIPPGADPT
jgi:hypothetical protein